MSFLDHLPAKIARLIETRFICEFASITKAGVPIDSPLVPFASADRTTLESATGLAYPAKAERVRRNPRVGMLFEGTAEEPVVSISGYACARDRDLQANLERYLSEQILTAMLDPKTTDYTTLTGKAIWYFTRIILCVKPAVVRWWDNPLAMDGPPQIWRADAETQWPQSDPPPSGLPTSAPWSIAPDWQAMAASALARNAPAHLTLIDSEGFPLPIRAREVATSADGLTLIMPGGLPWSSGMATVSFEGIETLVGTARIEGNTAHFQAQRALPLHPLMTNPAEILRPSPATRDALMTRITAELARRGQPLPQMPATAPEPTAGARLRAENAMAFAGFAASGD